ncbi:MAG: c-type cytochrome, partial [Acidobacteriota bacterium]
MKPAELSSDRPWLWVAISSVVFLVVLAISPLKDYFREDRAYQQEYRQLLLDRAGTRKELAAAESMAVRIRQIWIPELSNQVDRCVTCHLGVTNSSMQGVPEPFRAHPRVPHVPDDLPRFGCVVCHRGQGRATTRVEAHGDTEDWDAPLLPLRYTEASCGTCHLDDVVPEASLLTAGRKLISQAGCLGCHLVAGHENWRTVAPDLDGLREKTDASWLRAWLKDPRALRPGTWMPQYRLDDDEIEALVAFLWSQPPTAGQTVGRPSDLPPGGYDRGRKVFRESRCISCHTVEGRGNGSAPELVGIGSKVNRPWLVAFLRDPHAFQPDIAMPYHNFTRQDLLDISQYMMEEFVDPSLSDADGPPPATGLKIIARGEKIYKESGCGGCHRIAGRDDSARIGPELTGIGNKPVSRLDFGKRDDLPRTLPDWLAAKITSPGSFHDGLKMPTLKMTDEQVEAVITALLATSDAPVPPAYRVEARQASYDPPGRFGRLLNRYRCMSCHQIAGAGGDISTAPLTAEGSRVHEDWLTQYLLVPSTIRPLLTDRMVHLKIPTEEAAFMANFMANVYVDNDIPDEIFPGGAPPARVERGRRLFQKIVLLPIFFP